MCEGLLGGSSVEEGVGQPAGVPQVVMEWIATITVGLSWISGFG